MKSHKIKCRVLEKIQILLPFTHDFDILGNGGLKCKQKYIIIYVGNNIVFYVLFGGEGVMKLFSEYNGYKRFTLEEASDWGRKNYGNWLLKLQNQEYLPQTPAEEFFRYYTQGAHKFFNIRTRRDEIDTYDYSDSFFKKEMFDDSIREINSRPIPDDIVVYRYIPKSLVNQMLVWGNSKSLKKNVILIDRGFFSTTLSLEAVANQPYANDRTRSLFIVYIPRGTPAVYVDLVSDMNEQEMLFAPGIRIKVIDKHIFGKVAECIVC